MGRVKKFYKNSNKLFYSYFLNTNNQLEGEYYQYFPSGVLSHRISYLDGRLHGLSQKFDESGELVEHLVYYKGIMAKNIEEEENFLIKIRFALENVKKKRYLRPAFNK